MKFLKKKEDSEWEKDIVLLILQGIPIFGILILVTLGALNYQYDILNTGNRSQSDSGEGKSRVFQLRQFALQFSLLISFWPTCCALTSES